MCGCVEIEVFIIIMIKGEELCADFVVEEIKTNGLLELRQPLISLQSESHLYAFSLHAKSSPARDKSLTG